MHKPTIYEALCAKLGRHPTHAEQVEDVKRILEEAAVERASQPKPAPTRKRRRRA